MTTLTVCVNGHEREVTTATSLHQLVAEVAQATPAVVAVNGEHIPRDQLASYQLASGDTIEILTVRQGG